MPGKYFYRTQSRHAEFYDFFFIIKLAARKHLPGFLLLLFSLTKKCKLTEIMLMLYMLRKRLDRESGIFARFTRCEIIRGIRPLLK